MSSIEKVYQFLEEAQTYYLATVLGLVGKKHKVLFFFSPRVSLHKHRFHRVGLSAC